MSIKDQDHIIVGKLGATYGIKGWLKVFSYTEQSESIFSYTPWMIKIKGEWKEIRVESWKRHGQGLVAKFRSF